VGPNAYRWSFIYIIHIIFIPFLYFVFFTFLRPDDIITLYSGK
jgi:hypothetical protein